MLKERRSDSVGEVYKYSPLERLKVIGGRQYKQPIKDFHKKKN